MQQAELQHSYPISTNVIITGYQASVNEITISALGEGLQTVNFLCSMELVFFLKDKFRLQIKTLFSFNKRKRHLTENNRL